MYFSSAMTKIAQGLIFLWKRYCKGSRSNWEKKNEWDGEIHTDFENAVKAWSTCVRNKIHSAILKTALCILKF